MEGRDDGGDLRAQYEFSRAAHVGGLSGRECEVAFPFSPVGLPAAYHPVALMMTSHREAIEWLKESCTRWEQLPDGTLRFYFLASDAG